VAVTVLFVVSQIKINVTNAYAGSLAWSNFFARLTHSHPGRVVWLVFNVGSPPADDAGRVRRAGEGAGPLQQRGHRLDRRVVADLVINKPLGLSPPGIEFRRAHLYDFNPVGLGAMVLGAAVAGCAYAGCWARRRPSRPDRAGLSMLLSPLLAWPPAGATTWRASPTQWQRGEIVRCAVCENAFEAEDMARCPAYAAPICSLCCSLNRAATTAARRLARPSSCARWPRLLPARWALKVNFRLGQYLMVTLSLCALITFVLGVVYVQESLNMPSEALRVPFLKVFALLALLAAVAPGGWC
jgi:hypothetical protein